MADRKLLARYGAIEGALARSLLRLLHHFPGPDRQIRAPLGNAIIAAPHSRKAPGTY